MNTKFSIVAIMLVAAVLFSFGRAQAGSSPPPLNGLAGNYAGQGSGTFAVCFNSDFSAVEDCSTAPNAVFFSQVEITQSTQDTKGNSCQTITATNSPEFPSPAGPADTFVQINVWQTTSYNQATQTGIDSGTAYTGGPGTYCNGSVLVNTVGAAPTATVTEAFTVSQFGNRQDAIVQTFEAEPISYVGNLVFSGYQNRQ